MLNNNSLNVCALRWSAYSCVHALPFSTQLFQGCFCSFWILCWGLFAAYSRLCECPTWCPVLFIKWTNSLRDAKNDEPSTTKRCSLNIHSCWTEPVFHWNSYRSDFFSPEIKFKEKQLICVYCKWDQWFLISQGHWRRSVCTRGERPNTSAVSSSCTLEHLVQTQCQWIKDSEVRQKESSW